MLFHQNDSLLTNILFTESKETSSEKDSIPLSLRIRAAMATALGASAAHAKLLADQEDREIQLLVATIIETQVYYSFLYL